MRLWQRAFSSEPNYANPVTRAIPSRRISRLRLSWFILGTAFGAAITYYIAASHHENTDAGSRPAGGRSYALLDAAMASLPARPLQATLPAPIVAAPARTAPIQAAPSASTAAPASSTHLTLTVERGDTLASLLMNNGISQDESFRITQGMKQVYNPRRLSIGQSVDLHLSADRHLVQSLSIAASPLTTVALTRTANDEFSAREIKSPVLKGVMHSGGVITSSLYQTGIDSGIPPQLLGDVINALSFDVDLQRDIKEGDALDVVYERYHTPSNQTAGYGNVLYASLVHNGHEMTLYRHQSLDGYAGYYNEKGESVKKALLKTPINGAHITSSFGMRMHPLLGYTKMHKGIDFGAPTGTPIYAAGDGVVAFAGVRNGYGNFVIIKHNGTYSTGYGHASRIAHGIRPGARVKQGQVIAYVGSTGRSTGPHLHYEIMVNGTQVNPAGVKFRTGQVLQARELQQFRHEVTLVQTALATTPTRAQLAALATKAN